MVMGLILLYTLEYNLMMLQYYIYFYLLFHHYALITLPFLIIMIELSILELIYFLINFYKPNFLTFYYFSSRISIIHQLFFFMLH